MKNIIIILLAFTLNLNAQQSNKKCITVKVEKIENYRVKVVTTDTCKKSCNRKNNVKKRVGFFTKKKKIT